MRMTPRLTLPATKPSHPVVDPSSTKSLPPWSPDSPTAPKPPAAPESDPFSVLYGYIIKRPRRLEFIKFLGAGAFGCVFLAEDIDWVEPPSPPPEVLVKTAATNPPNPRNLPWFVETSSAIESPSAPESTSLSPLLDPSAVVTKPLSAADSSLPLVPDLENMDYLTAAQTFFPLPRYYAVKCLDNRAISRRQRLREINHHLAAQKHRGVLELYACVQQDGWTFLVLEYAEKGDMLKCMAENVYSVCDVRIGEVFLQLVDTVGHCHRNSVFHRDLKPENIMCRAGGLDIALGDFGLSTSDKESTEFGCGSTYYMSPECLAQGFLSHDAERPLGWKPKPYDTEKNDVWALGIILINMICSRCPWAKAMSSDADFMAYRKSPLFLRDKLPISWAAYDVLRDILEIDPDKRITIPRLMEKIRKIKTFRMTPWEIEASNSTIQEAAVWLPADWKEHPQEWTREETCPADLDSPSRPVLRDPVYPYYPKWATYGRPKLFEVESCTSVESADIVPTLEPSSEEDEKQSDSAPVTPEALVGVDPDTAVTELDLAEGLHAWERGAELVMEK